MEVFVGCLTHLMPNDLFPHMLCISRTYATEWCPSVICTCAY